ncbi:radical SAM protein [Shewanella intestini]|uniref:Radical SAM protein n=1 Tax=Shewanella intestini TaxID=2017544 RepID=A0ABS5I5S8_9GAMM|nr:MULTISPECIES: radical SAM protein [Shewanella]MBR9729372.1 radical SAM protein [Shewanella intestini]MRG37451.1 radical SAM protein [Shewanella sp. XMDDZSB0408]
MSSFEFQQGPIRPPSEADSLLIRTTVGCPWNKCNFCTLFKGMQASVRSVEAIKKDIWAAKQFYKNRKFKQCFLQDGDSFSMDTEDLIEVLTTLKQAFPELTQISSYGRAQTMTKKSSTEMKAICDAGLNMLYCGLESGSIEVLKQSQKGITPKSIVKSAAQAKQAGMKMMAFVIAGLGGKALSAVHVRQTAAILNQINPDEIRVLSLAVKAGSELDKLRLQGEFEPLTEIEMVREQQQLLSLLDKVDGRYGHYHGINLLTEINGKLPENKAHFSAIFQRFFALSEQEQNNFILGRRLHYYASLDSMKNQLVFDTVTRELARIEQDKMGELEDIFYQLRQRMI